MRVEKGFRGSLARGKKGKGARSVVSYLPQSSMRFWLGETGDRG